MPGLLFDLGAYPAALRGAGGSIRGEVYRLLDPGLWVALDSAEGSQYHRGEVGVRMSSGGDVTAAVYWFVAPSAGPRPSPVATIGRICPPSPFIIADPIRGGFPWLCSRQS